MQYIYFTANWCAPCKMVKPLIAQSNKSIRIVDVDTNRELASMHGIKSVPTLIGIQNDIRMETYNGAPAIMAFLNK